MAENLIEISTALKFGQEAQDFRLLTKSPFWQYCEQAFPNPILDLGCGAGSFSSALVDSGCRVVALDIHKTVLRQTAKQFKAYFTAASAAILPFQKDSFAAVLCLEVLSHIPFEEQVRVAREIHRVLVPKGKVVVSVHNPLRLGFGRLLHGELPAKIYENSGATIYPISPKRLQSIFCENGFELEGVPHPVNYYNSLPRRHPGLIPQLRPIEDMLQKLPLIRHFSIENLAIFRKMS